MAFVRFPVLGFGSPYFDSLIEVYQFFKYIIPLNPTCCCFIVAVFPVKCQAVLHSNINHHSPLNFPLKISFLSSSFSFCLRGCSHSWGCLLSPLSFLCAMEMKSSSFPSRTMKESTGWATKLNKQHRSGNVVCTRKKKGINTNFSSKWNMGSPLSWQLPQCQKEWVQMNFLVWGLNSPFDQSEQTEHLAFGLLHLMNSLWGTQYSCCTNAEFVSGLTDHKPWG